MQHQPTATTPCHQVKTQLYCSDMHRPTVAAETMHQPAVLLKHAPADCTAQHKQPTVLKPPHHQDKHTSPRSDTQHTRIKFSDPDLRQTDQNPMRPTTSAATTSLRHCTATCGTGLRGQHTDKHNTHTINHAAPCCTPNTYVHRTTSLTRPNPQHNSTPLNPWI
jgi:hypothetical protein